MAYRRKYGSYKARKRTGRFTRRFAAKKRTYRRTKRTSRPMTKKRILNTTSRKKRNTMLSVTNTNPAGASQPIGTGPALVAGNSTARFLWCPTAMNLVAAGGGLPSVVLEAARTSQTCFMRGLSENIRVQTSTGLPWFHRRICFTVKGIEPFLTRADADTGTLPNSPFPYVDTTNGMQRLWLNMTINNMQNTINEREGVLFKGANGLDWNDILTAPVDTSRVTVKFDKTWTIKSGNANGTVYERKLWHPMNKNLVYDDDESGETEVTSYWSTSAKPGMGDYYVYDIVTPGQGGTSADLLLLQSTTSLYWHEK